MGRSNTRSSRHKDKLRKRQDRQQVMQSFTYSPVDNVWRNHRIDQLKLPLPHFPVIAVQSSDLPLTDPVAFSKITADGNCFFRCLSYIITGSEKYYHTIRLKTCEYMTMHPNDIKFILPKGAKGSSMTYLKDSKMQLDNSWASEVEVFTASLLLSTNIYLYSKHGVHWTWLQHSSPLNTSGRGLYLYHKDENHFDLVIGIENSSLPADLSANTKYYFSKKSQTTVRDKQQKNQKERKRYSMDETFRTKKKMKLNKKYKTNTLFRTMTKLNQRQKYASNPEFAFHKKQATKERYRNIQHYRFQLKSASVLKYSTNALFRNQLKQFSKQKYASDNAFRNRLKMYSSKKYRSEGSFRKRVQQYSKRKYAEDVVHKDNLQQYSRRKYAENIQHKQAVQQFSKMKYAGNIQHRQKVQQYSRRKYAENIQHKQKVLQHSKTKYHTFASFRNHLKASSVKKYAKNPLFRNGLKLYLRNKYQHDRTIQDLKKTRVAISRQSISKAIHKFIKDINLTPQYVCTVCIRILYRKQVKLCKRNQYTIHGTLNEMAAKCLTGTYVHSCEDNSCSKKCVLKNANRHKEWICHNCHRYLKQNKMPPQAQVNNLFLTAIPPALQKLNVLERQLISLRIPFMKLLSLPRGGQKGVKGPVVNVPSDLNNITTSLPRNASDAQLIKVKLKRKLSYKGHYSYKWINPKYVLDALKNLIRNNFWYENITVNNSWLETFNDSSLIQPESSENESDSDDETTPECTEQADSVPVDTCFQPIDIGQDTLDTNKTLCIAPAENQKPQNIFQEDGSDAMAFPVLLPDGHFGLFEDREIKLSPAKYFNARLFCADSRFATDKEFLFFSQYVTEINYISSNISLALRKGKQTTDDGEKVTASMLLNSDNVNQILKSDAGYRFLQPVRGTPPYWQRTLKDLYAMIRQLGIPTWFVTFSAAEMRWDEVINTLLYLNNDNRPVSDIEWSERSTMVTDNPVTCARMFDHRVKSLFSDIILSPSKPLGNVIDYFYRTEFQQRGSPHIHCLLWVKDAPKLNESTDEEVCNFIDHYITCETPDEDVDPQLFEIISSVQMHSQKHSKSCKKYSSTCRFNFPRPPVHKTFIARVESEDKEQPVTSKSKQPTIEELNEICKASAKTAKQILRDIWILISSSEHTNLTFSEILQLANVTYSQYQQSLKDIATRNTVHLKRKLSDIWVNNYNEHLSRAWNANLDIQFVTDPYACVAYILSYISKAESEMGDLLQNAKQEADEGNMDVITAMRQIGNVYLQNREVSAQEAVYRVTGLHLKECTREVIFLPAGNNILKMSLPMTIIKSRCQQGGDDENIWMSSIHDKYYARPHIPQFEDISLAEFCSKYRILSKSQKPSSDTSKSTKTLPVFELQGDLGFIQKRKPDKEAVIRYPRFNRNKNSEEYYLTLLQIYLPHRNPITLPAEVKSYEEYVRNGYQNGRQILTIIEENRHHFEIDIENLEKAWEDMQEGKIQEESWAFIAPEAEVERIEIEMERQPQALDEAEEIPELRVNEDQNSQQHKFAFEYHPPKISQKDIKQALRKLNNTQQQIFYKMRDWCLQVLWNHHPDPFYVFLTGGAGTGKSHLIKCIFHEATRILSKCSTSPDSVSILLTAPTGTAAFNIEGLTIHSAFALNKKIKLPYQSLGENILNTLRSKFDSMKLLIIDEVSMVDQKILSYIHGRLAQLKHSKKPFGNLSILAVGDFHQLPPVAGLALYKVRPSDFMDLWNTHFSVATLTEVMRQKEDAFFAALLNRLRVHRRGQPLLPEDKEALLKISYNETPEDAKDVLHIFSTNKEVQKHNDSMVMEKCNPIFTLMAKDFYRDIVTGQVSQKEEPYSNCTSEDLQTAIKIGVGARIMLTRNIDTDDGLVNGAFGSVTAIDYINPTHITAVYVKFDNPKIGQKYMKKAILDRSRKGSVKIQPFEETLSGKHVTRKQYPLKLGWAATIHKVQGMTVNDVVVSLKNIFQPGMAYVALSRATSMKGLRILNFDPDAIYSSEDITEAVRKMPSFLPAHNTSPSVDRTNSFKIFYHNTEGIIPHLEDIKHIAQVKDSDVVCFTETWLKKKINLPSSLLPHYHPYLLSRADAYDSTSRIFSKLASMDRGGVAILTKSNLSHSRFTFKSQNIEAIAVIINQPVSLLLVTVYRPPGYPLYSFSENFTAFLQDIEEIRIPSIIIGDFNENILCSETNNLFQKLNNFGYQQLVKKPTTESGSCLDLVFVKEYSDTIQVNIVPTFYSFHDALQISMKY